MGGDGVAFHLSATFTREDRPVQDKPERIVPARGVLFSYPDSLAPDAEGSAVSTEVSAKPADLQNALADVADFDVSCAAH